MNTFKKIFWPLVALAAVALSCRFLYQELQDLTLKQLLLDIKAVPAHRYFLAFLATCVAYFALAWYDRIALLHIGVRHISWLFVSLSSFTTYALAHNIGVSVLSGAVVRYRAYTSKGLSPAQIAILVALCAFTFVLGVIILCGIVFTWRPDLISRFQFDSDSPFSLPNFLTDPTFVRAVGICLLSFVVFYIIGSLLHLRPLRFKRFVLEYPRPPIMLRQIIAGPLELLGAAGIIYFILPEAWNIPFIAVLAIFLVSFSIALVSNAPGGVGVFEAVFFAAMPDLDPLQKSQVFASLLIFRILYLLIPLVISVGIVIVYEKLQLKQKKVTES